MPARSQRSPFRRLAVGVTAVLLLLVGLVFLAPGGPTDAWLVRSSYDVTLRFDRPPTNAAINSPVVIVYLDRDSYLREERDPQELWDRRLHAALVRRLTKAGARAVVFDIVFAEPGLDPQADRELADAIRRNGRVILAAELNDWRRQTGQTADLSARSPVLPYEPLRTAAAGWGLASLRVDDDYAVRRYFPGYLEQQQPSLTWAAAQRLHLEAEVNPNARSGDGWVRYSGPPLSIPNVSYSAALRPDEVSDSFFRERIVLVGARPMVSGFPDRRDEYRSPWPVPGRGTPFMPAVEVHATQMANLAQNNFLRRPERWIEVLILAVLAFGLPALLFRFRPLPAAGVALLLEVALLGTVAWAFTLGWWAPWLLVGLIQIPGALGGSVLFHSAEWYRQRRQLEAARQEAEAKIREQAALLDKAQDAIFVRDLNGRVSYINAAAERLFGWPAAEWMDGRAAESVFALDPDKIAEAEILSATEGEWLGELELVTRDGSRRTVQSRWTLIRDAAGKAHSRLLINTDITEKKRLEAQFLRSQRMEIIGTLAGGMAHDLNSALAPVLMGIQLIRRETTDPETQRLLAVMETNTYRGADMVRQVLLFSRGAMDERQSIDLRTLLREVERIVGQSFPSNVAVSLLAPRDLWPVWGNPTQLHQVLLNLCVNARDAMPRGGELSLSADNVQLDSAESAQIPDGRAGDFVMLLVADTGEGIAPEILPRLFEPFFTTKPTGQGTGLGLATVARIVTAHGGFWNVRSEVDVGTTFEIYLPRLSTEPPAPADATEHEAPRGRGEGILVLEDDRAVAELLTQALRDQGYQPFLACNPAEAVDLARTHASQLSAVLLDATLAEEFAVSGTQWRQQLPQAAVFVMSETEDSTSETAVNADGLLVKPFGLPELFRRLAEILARRRR
ncbi:MAG TPA: CHASE2 domain-containing protein [Verrucomicrobiota bacterium]|nr:hypothetical protein [Verrucomicrobiales bacterium]HRI13447.1 CHASE2 domain-containing protein [Verrucomicrobiota bacterium]